jgi:hypothetical protein
MRRRARDWCPQPPAEEWHRRCSRMPTCTMSSTNGPISGDDPMRTGTWSSCVGRMTSWWVLSIVAMRSGSLRIYASASRSSRWSCRPRRRPDHVWAARHPAARGAGPRPAGDVRLPGLHARLRQDQGRALHAEARHDLETDASCAKSKTNSSAGGICPSRNRGDGWEAWCEGTSPTMPCPATRTQWRLSAPRSHGTGTERCDAAASARD